MMVLVVAADCTVLRELDRRRAEPTAALAQNIVEDVCYHGKQLPVALVQLFGRTLDGGARKRQRFRHHILQPAEHTLQPRH